MGINKIVYGGVTKLDISNDTVTPSSLLQGYTAHDNTGALITGTATGGGTGAISVVDTTDTHGGTIRTITAVDISDTTAVASDVASGKYFYTADGTKTAGTASGGGGLEYEEGTWTPTEETGYPTILFAKNHDTLPTIISLTDIGEGFTPTGTTAVTVWQYYDAWKMAGHGFPSSSNTLAYSYIDIFYVSTSGGIGSTRVATSHNSSETGSGAQYPSYYVSTTAFMPYSNGARYYKAGRTYKWIAVWAPTT